MKPAVTLRKRNELILHNARRVAQTHIADALGPSNRKSRLALEVALVSQWYAGLVASGAIKPAA
jgi:hypothetical protein